MAFSDNLLDNILELFKVLDHVSFATSKTRFVSIIKTCIPVVKPVAKRGKVSGKSDSTLQFFVNNSKTADLLVQACICRYRPHRTAIPAPAKLIPQGTHCPRHSDPKPPHISTRPDHSAA